MTESKESNLIRKYCKGEGESFVGTPCARFSPLTSECKILKEGHLNDIFSERCKPYNLLVNSIKRELKRKGLERFDSDVKTHLIYNRLARRERINLDRAGYNLNGLHKYLYKCAIRAVAEIPRRVRKKCGECEYLHGDKRELFCSVLEIFNRQTQAFEPNPFFMQKRTKRDKGCEGFKTKEMLPHGGEKEAPDPISIEEELVTKDKQYKFLTYLQEAQDAEEEGSKQYEICKRQKDIFLLKANLVLEFGLDHKEADKKIMEILNINEKMLQRDNKDLLKKWKEIMSSES